MITLCITDIARQKNSAEPKDVVKNWMRQKNTLEYLGLWERLHNPNFKGVEFDPLLNEAGSNSFNTMEFLGVWERVYNPNFNYGEFATIRNPIEFEGINSTRLLSSTADVVA